MKPVEELKYNEAIGELQQIVNRMQSNDCDIDLLVEMTTRATALINECRSRLTKIEKQVINILPSIDNQVE